MALKFTDDVTIPESTGAVPTPAEPVTTVQPFTNNPSGAVPHDGEPVTTTFGPSGQKPTGAVPTPGPVTVENTVVKVVRAPARGEARHATTAETGSQKTVQPEPDGR